MQLVHHDIVDLGKPFADQCFEEYSALVQREIQVPTLSKNITLEGRRKLLTLHYRKIVHFTQEIQQINQDIVFDNDVESPTHKISKHKFFLTQQQHAYDQEWWRNSTRKQQANTLFENLRIIKTTDRTQFFKESLDQILESQKEILRSDVNTNRKTKGYSRLYDITVQMSIYLANELIQDRDISMADKVWLNERMIAQMEHHIQLLGERLPENHEYKKLFSDYSYESMKPGSTKFELFQRGISKVDTDSIPKNMRYLVTNIDCFVDIAGHTSSELDKENYNRAIEVM